MLLASWMVQACAGAPAARGVYRSGPNAIVAGNRTGEVRVFGPAGTFGRLASPGPAGTTLLGQAGPLWVVDRDVPAPKKAARVDASMVERAGWRLQDVLGTIATAAPDAARAGGVYVRSVVKVRRDHAPPVYVVAATVDTVGAGRFDGPEDVRSGDNCRAAVAVMDIKGDTLLHSAILEAATRTCAVPAVLPPVDLDGDGDTDLLVHGQHGHAGFRSWFTLTAEGTLVAGSAEAWEAIP